MARNKTRQLWLILPGGDESLWEEVGSDRLLRTCVFLPQDEGEVMAFNSQIGQSQFLQLLVAQMKAQNPLEPTTNQEFLGQLAQFSTLSAMETMNANFSDLMSLQQLTQGSTLIGKQVSYTNSNDQTATGVVQSLSVSDGKVKLQVGSDVVTLDKVSGIAA